MVNKEVRQRSGYWLSLLCKLQATKAVTTPPILTPTQPLKRTSSPLSSHRSPLKPSLQRPQSESCSPFSSVAPLRLPPTNTFLTSNLSVNCAASSNQWIKNNAHDKTKALPKNEHTRQAVLILWYLTLLLWSLKNYYGGLMSICFYYTTF